MLMVLFICGSVLGSFMAYLIEFELSWGFHPLCMCGPTAMISVVVLCLSNRETVKQKVK